MTAPQDSERNGPAAADAAAGAGARGRGGRIPAGRRAVRFSPLYGRVVGGLKVLLPTVAVALVLVAVAWPLLNEGDRRFTDALTGADRRAAENLAVENARYSGIEEDGQPFSITAESMQQESVDSSTVALTEPKADILLSNGAWVAVTAKSGLLHRTKQVLELTEDVNLFHDSGYEFRTARAVLDLTAGSATGNTPVEGQGPFGYLEAEGFRVTERGDRVTLTGRSTVVIYPQAEGES